MAWLVDYPREKVNWFPTIAPGKCVKCNMCMKCGKVYAWTQEDPVVSKPLACVVGCTTCAHLCEGEAISFPDKNDLRALYKKEHLWAKVTRLMKAEGKLTPTNH